MDLLVMLLEYIGVIWIALVVVMLPVYFIKKKFKPNDEKNTVKSLLVKSLIVSIIFTLVFCSGLIAMYIDDTKGSVTVHAAEVSGDASGEASKKVKKKPKKIVALDPGHSSIVAGGVEPVGPGSKTMKAKDASGTCGVVTKIPEYKLTMKLAKKMKKLLEKKGYKVVMTRNNNNKKISCIERAKVANKAKADIFIRIHADGINSPSVSGASALYPTTRNPYINKKLSKKSKKLSTCILDEMCKNAGTKSRGLSGRDDLTGTNWAKMPVTLIEVGFMTNPAEDRLLSTDEYQDKLAAGMVKGIDKYFGYKQ